MSDLAHLAELRAAALSANEALRQNPTRAEQDDHLATLHRFEETAIKFDYAALSARVQTLEKVADRLPKTADGVHVFDQDRVWIHHNGKVLEAQVDYVQYFYHRSWSADPYKCNSPDVYEGTDSVDIEDTFSTEAAALSAIAPTPEERK